jgi:hypothetical protein
MDGWMDGWMDRWMDGWMDGWIDGWMNEWMDGWMDGWMDRWMNGWMGRQIDSQRRHTDGKAVDMQIGGWADRQARRDRRQREDLVASGHALSFKREDGVSLALPGEADVRLGFGILEFWNFGILEFWNLDLVKMFLVLWYFGIYFCVRRSGRGQVEDVWKKQEKEGTNPHLVSELGR